MIHVWRDTPKPGETDAKWCGRQSKDGHVILIACGFDDEDEARAFFEPPVDNSEASNV